MLGLSSFFILKILNLFEGFKEPFFWREDEGEGIWKKKWEENEIEENSFLQA